MKKTSVWVGFDQREASSFAVACYSLRTYASRAIQVRGVVLSDLQRRGLYTRPTKRGVNSEGRFELIDELSRRPDFDGRLSTEHAIARFLVPSLAKEGWAMFMDGDMLVRGDVVEMLDNLDPSKALYCVHHNHVPKTKTKMDGQVQTKYHRKNWSSVMVFNCDHESNRPLTPSAVNSISGRDLHRFCWLKDEEIGELGPEWNYLVGEDLLVKSPKIIHYTSGPPDMPGYEKCEYAEDWRNELAAWALAAPG